MDHRRFLILGLCAMGAAIGLAQDKETWDDSMPSFYVISFVKDGHDASKTLTATLAKVRASDGDKNVLFLTADTTSRASRHQSKLLLNSLGIDRDIWTAGFKAPGTLVFVDSDSGVSVVKLDAKADAKTITETMEKLLAPQKDAEDDEGDGEGMGEDEEGDG